jgi:hypothetical protein
MFGALIRAGPYLLFTALMAGVLAWVMQFLLQPIAAAPGAQDHMLYNALSVFTDPAVPIIIGGVTIVVGLLVAAIVDSSPGVS